MRKLVRPSRDAVFGCCVEAAVCGTLVLPCCEDILDGGVAGKAGGDEGGIGEVF